MEEYHVWIGTFSKQDFEQYWDNEPYESAMKRWKNGSGAKPGEDLKCGFCREMGLEELEETDFWFYISASRHTGRELAEYYMPLDLDAFETACRERGIEGGNVIWGISVKDFPGENPAACKSMTYIGTVNFR